MREQLLTGIMRVQAANCADMVANPEGEYPCCKNAVGTWRCERCGSDVRTMRGLACPAVPKEKRWSFAKPIVKVMEASA